MCKNRHFIITTLYILLMAVVFPSCKSVKLSDADDTLARGEYFNASNMYRKIYNRLTKPEERPLRGEVAYKLATCYQRLNRPANAVASYQNALRYGQTDSIIYLRLAQMLQATGKYPQAITEYEKFLEWNPDDPIAKAGIRGCHIAIASKEAPKSRYIVKQSKILNSRRSDFAPMYFDKNYDVLYFTTTNEKATGDNKSEITGMKKGDIWMVKKNEKGEWQRPGPVDGELNSDADEGIVSFSPDGQTMYLTVAKRSETSSTTVEIYTSRRSEASWSAPQKFEILNDTVTAVGHPAVSPDGRYLYFTSDMPGGYGGLDIWRINLQERGGSLENLGPQINTQGNESFPYVRTDSTLYFSSDGHSGFGGLDIFKAQLNSTGDRWSIYNMGQPINSTGDDFGITFGPGESGFFSSNRGDARGYDHIYSFLLPDLKISIEGWVVDKDDEPVPNAIIRIVGNDGSNQKEVARDDGSFRFNLQRGVKYVMMAGAKGYLNQKVEFESDTAEEDAEYGMDFILASISKPSVVENIFYDFDKATLRPESKEALDELAVMLEDNPNVSIEMSAHTDRKGSEEYNIDLSERRAKSVVDYLVEKGINPSRLTWTGYGKTRPKTVTKRINKEFSQFEEGTELTPEYIETLSEEDQEAADQINRRTEFQVTAIDTDFELM
ncbi:MAG: OmpA family protein [Muribaculaceae bacterium]|nr:OmpA family protein [Muribaculaceae bacterium]